MTLPEEAGITRFGKPEDIADLMAYMVSPAAKSMTELLCSWTAAKSRASDAPRSPLLSAQLGGFPWRTYGSAKGEGRAIGGVFRQSVF
ncbi:MAG: hypothetical protein WA708_00165 [Acidobacteriaceae bacterium]